MSKENQSSDSVDLGLGPEVSHMQKQVSQYLDKQTESIDYNVESRLSAARHRAISTRKQSTRFYGPWMRGVSIASVLILVGVLGQSYLPVNPEQVEVVSVSEPSVVQQQDWIEDINLLSASDDLEFFESVEFLEWMEQNSG